MEAKAESSKHIGRERTNSNGETVRMEQLRREGECGNVMPPFVTRGVTSFGNRWGEKQGTIAVIGRKVPALGRDSTCLFPGIPA